MPDDLDEIDVCLVAALQRDAKTSLNRLGEQVGLSAPSVMERIRKLEQSGVILGYYAAVDAPKLGLDIAAFIGVSLNYPLRVDAFEKWAREDPRILECHHVTGGSTLLLKVKARNTRDLEALISAIRRLDGVERTETMIVLSTSVERTQIPLDVPAAIEGRRKRAKRDGTSVGKEAANSKSPRKEGR